ncbi:hypothetical protein D8Y22_05240 [Salinadaptatus halalkaliphilus]|uniref:Uncharacterized protein n=1 Tax=Salinadaptatus halalkaliphilus TaxID=2419781 RepID=A0A4S3TNZ7_9EURY|nr:hypothetical protein [Salinadaptatus halalkaliphilus]THE65926.1 hypothetical protein D8Y22_05240 [Salinadaptatus halalkaliphilus]
MTDSTIDNKSGEGDLDVGSSAEELFGGINEESPEAEVDRSKETASAEDEDAAADDASDIEDQTAASVFGQLKSDVDSDGADEVLADESPDDIIASADEPDPDHEPLDDALRPDDDELADLLLTGRTKDQEFLWIETEEDADADSVDWSGADDAGVGTDTGGDDTETDDPETPDSNAEPATTDARAVEDAERDADLESGSTQPTVVDSDTTESSPAAEADSTESESAPVESDAVTAESAAEPNDDGGEETLESATAETQDCNSSAAESVAPASDDEDSQALAVHESETADVPASAADDDTDDDSPGFVRRLLAKLNPF